MATPQPPTQNIPGMNLPLVDGRGYPTQAWYRFLVVLWSGLGIPLTFPFQLPGLLTAAQQFGVVLTDPCTFPAAFSGSVAKSSAGPSAQAQFQVNKISDGIVSPLGSITFTNSSLDGVFASTNAAQQKLLAGDILQIVSPGIPDLSLSGVYITFRGTRS